jgi:hypothetical protein
MRAQTLPLILSLALSSSAIPHAGNSHQHLHRAAAPAPVPSSAAGGDTFDITINNNCGSDMSFGIYQVSASFSMNTISEPVAIPAGSNGTLEAPYQGIGMRVSGSADESAASQWTAQALFEFGYSAFNGIEGTAYDLSVMGGDNGLAVYPENTQCPSKVCTPTDCALDQGWTNQDQVEDGSPADTVCYHGKTNFYVVWCPDT